MRVFITSTPEELEPLRRLAVAVVRELGSVPTVRDPGILPGVAPMDACVRQIANADAVLAIVGHRRGDVPPPRDGGDGRHPWAWWETRAAFERELPVRALLAGDDWRPDLRAKEDDAQAVMSDFRGELARLGASFRDEYDFRDLARELIAAAGEDPPLVEKESPAQRLRSWPPRTLPAHPFPGLLPYAHPELLAGRDRELDEIRHVLKRPVAITGLHAPSGTGKSSFLYGGLVAGLRAEGRPVAFDRRPCEPGIVARLLGDLLDEKPDVADDDSDAFIEWLRAVLAAADEPPLLVLDQFEDLLRFKEADRACQVVGTLLAASVQRLPGLTEPPCRWLLAYRQEFHGEVFRWLGNLFTGKALPHDLSIPERFQNWTLSPLGTPPPGTQDRVSAASKIFQEAIEKPLRHYDWTFADDGAERLAQAFAEARETQRKAPLAPELQVVLAHLLDDGGLRTVTVPDDPATMIDSALEEYLRRSLDMAFPVGRKKVSILRRTRALLALRELADLQGRRDEGRPVEALARAIGEDGRDVLEKLATAQTRIVLSERHGDEQVYVLSHDRMAEVIVRLVDDEGAYAGLGVDAELLRWRRFVALQRELYISGEVEQATEVPKDHSQGIEQHTEALLWDDDGRRWWKACRKRRQRDRRRTLIRRSVAAVVVVLLTAVVSIWTQRYFERQALLETVSEGEPEAAFKALAELTAADMDAEEVRDQVRLREKPFDVVERGLGGVGEEERGEALIRVTELLLLLQQAEWPKDPEWIASMVWALDFFAGEERRDEALALRNQILGPIRKIQRPPLPGPDDSAWADIPAGTFMMGSGPGEGRDDPNMADEWPQHPVQLSAFRMMIHEVTNAEFGRLYPSWAEKESDLPANRMTWYEAYSYAAWLGGRLPTEAESEYVSRAGCEFAYCKRDGSEATLDEVAWWVGNSADPETGEPATQRIMQLEPNPWGLYDILGNVWEWGASWYYQYPEKLEVNPQGPTRDPSNYKTFRGGSAWNSSDRVVVSGRGEDSLGSGSRVCGFRVAM